MKATELRDAYFRTGAEAGCPADQMVFFWEHRIFLQPKQLAFAAAARSADISDGPLEIGYGGARGGAKSFASVAIIADDCWRFPGLKVLFLRKQLKSAKESFEDLRRAVLKCVPHIYKERAGVIEFPNKSRIFLGHYSKESDIDKYLGLEYDVAVIEEATSLTASTIRNIKTVVRTSKPGWRPRIYQTTNPGGIGHADFKRRFIDPYRKNEQQDTFFIPSTIDDNVMINADYRKTLDSLDGWQKRAWRYGDWDIAAGQYYSNWRQDVHVVKPFHIPEHWKIWGGFDYGFTHLTCFHLLAKDDDGNVYVIGEHAERKQLVDYHAAEMTSLVRRLVGGWDRVEAIYAGHDTFGAKGAPQTIAEQYQDYGIFMTKGNNDRIGGATAILKGLGNPDENVKPRIFVFDTCVKLIRCLPELQHNPNRPEDVLKIDVDDEGEGGDDCFIAGTRIKTSSGDIPIENLLIGDLVLTREGLRPIKAMWHSSLNSTTVKIDFENGNSIEGTPNHNVWVENKGWKPLDTIRHGDIITSWTNNQLYPKLSNLTGLNLDVIQTQKSSIIDVTTHQLATILNEGLSHYTSRYGNLFMEKCLQSITSIIRTETQQTIPLRIWYAFLRKNMLQFISKNLIGSLKHESILTQFGFLHPSGMVLQRGYSGTAKMQNEYFQNELNMNSYVNTVAKPLAQHFLAELNTVAQNARVWKEKNQELVTFQRSVLDAEKTFFRQKQTAECIAGKSANKNIVRDIKQSSERKTTYAIHVDGCHEYYANGVLAQNCYDSFRMAFFHEVNIFARHKRAKKMMGSRFL